MKKRKKKRPGGGDAMSWEKDVFSKPESKKERKERTVKKQGEQTQFRLERMPALMTNITIAVYRPEGMTEATEREREILLGEADVWAGAQTDTRRERKACMHRRLSTHADADP